MSEIIRKAARHIRHTVFTGIRAVGGFRSIVASAWRRRRLLILCYHGVSLLDERECNPELFVTPVFLRRRFEILRDERFLCGRRISARGVLWRARLRVRAPVFLPWLRELELESATTILTHRGA